MTKELRVLIPGEPRATPRARACRRGSHAGVYHPATYTADLAEIRRHMSVAMAGRDPIRTDVAIAVEVYAWRALPRSRWRKRAPRPAAWWTGKPDADNIAKTVLDAGNGVTWHDDSQVAVLIVYVLEAPQGRPPVTDVRIRPAGELLPPYPEVPCTD